MLAGVVVVAAAAAIAISMAAGQKPNVLTLFSGVAAVVSLLATVGGACVSFMESIDEVPAEKNRHSLSLLRPG